MRRSRYALALAIAGDLGLIAALFIIAGHGADRFVLAGVFAVPLLIALNGLCQARVYTAAWSAMLALFYMAYAMVEYIGGRAAIDVDLCLLASLMLFVGCVVFVRWRTRERL